MTEQEMQQFYVSMLKREMSQRAVLFERLMARFGNQVLDTVKETTIEQARERLEKADLQKRDLDTVVEALWDQMGEIAEFTVEERTPELLRFRVTRCLFADEMRALNAADIGFAFYCSYDYGFCQGLNPEIKFTRSQTLMQGDRCCDHTYELKIH
jgi:predicted ArsR family transcriptional regulator